MGIGGSATNDGGVGMLQALGYGFLDKEGRQVAFGAKGLEALEKITDMDVIPELARCGCLRCHQCSVRGERMQRCLRTAERS